MSYKKPAPQYRDDVSTALQQEAVLMEVYRHYCGKSAGNLRQAYEFVSTRWDQWVDKATGKYCDKRVANRMSNCRPTGQLQDSFTNKCNNQRVCPYCYGRNVIGESFESLRFGIQTYRDWRRRGKLKTLDLVVAKYNYGHQSFSSYLNTSMEAGNRDWFDKCELYGTLKVSQFLPRKVKNYQHTMLFMLLDRGAKMSAEQKKTTWLRLPVDKTLTEERLKSLVLNSIPYPSGLLDLDRVAAVLKLLRQCKDKKVRLMRSTGLFRNASDREIAARLKKDKENYGKTQATSRKPRRRVERGKRRSRPRGRPQ